MDVALGDIVVALAVLGSSQALKGLSQLKQFRDLWQGKEPNWALQDGERNRNSLVVNKNQ